MFWSRIAAGNMRRILVNVLAAIILLGSLRPVFAAERDWKEGKLGHLSHLIGKYGFKDKLLEDPEVERALLDLVGPEVLESIKVNISVRGPIDFTTGYLVISGCKQHVCPDHAATVWIRLRDGEVLAAVWDTPKMTVYAPASKYEYLPYEFRFWVYSILNHGPLLILKRPPPEAEWVR